MSKNATIQIRIDSKSKDDLDKILNELNMDRSSAINILIKQIIIHEEIPFTIKKRDKVFKDTTIQVRAKSEEKEAVNKILCNINKKYDISIVAYEFMCLIIEEKRFPIEITL